MIVTTLLTQKHSRSRSPIDATFSVFDSLDDFDWTGIATPANPNELRDCTAQELLGWSMGGCICTGKIQQLRIDRSGDRRDIDRIVVREPRESYSVEYWVLHLGIPPRFACLLFAYLHRTFI
jgi:hypothetical protein